MLGGKKLKDLTEEDVRKYAASLASGGPSQEDVSSGPQPLAAEEEVAEAEDVADARTSASFGDKTIVRAISKVEDIVEVEGRQLELARRDQEQEQERRKNQQVHLEAERQQRLAEEEHLRLQILTDLERSQMPAVRSGDGSLQKTIEHYTFADSEDTATISIELDKDLFEGAATFVLEENVEVDSRDGEVTILLHRVPAYKGAETMAEWRLHISPLFHSIEPDRTTWRIRKGKVSVKLKKRKAQDWRRLVKF